MCECVSVCVCVRACVRACACVRVRACVRACVHAGTCACKKLHVSVVDAYAFSHVQMCFRGGGIIIISKKK